MMTYNLEIQISLRCKKGIYNEIKTSLTTATMSLSIYLG